MTKDQAIKQALKQAIDLQNNGDFVKAELVLKTILSHYPKNADAYNLLGTLCHQMGKSQLAVPLIEKAIKLNGKRFDFYNNLGNAYREMGELKKAGFAFKKALKLKPDSLPARSNLGNIYVALGDVDKGIREQKKTLQIHPNYHIAHFNLGNSYLEKGQKEDAIACYRRTIALEPTFAKAYRNIVETKKFKEMDSDISALESFLNSGKIVNTEDEVQLLFGAAKAYDDLKEADKSWDYLKAGNDLHRTTFDYKIEDDLSLMEGLKKTVTADYIAKNKRHAKQSLTPIFILGMPRSGTSLIEQILASHPEIYGAGELYFFEQLVYHKIKHGKTVDLAQILPDMQSADFDQCAKYYMDFLKALPTNSKIITDKMPRNFLYVGLIKILFPGAKIIHCRRQAEDSCLSIYKKIFVGQQKFAYDLTELGQYYNGYLDLMDHWYDAMPGEILDVHYEDMVGDTENQIRKLLAHCGVDWHDGCLNFHKTNRVVRTASTDQVRQPIYNSSVAAWRQYEKQLAPLSKALQSRRKT